MALAEQINSIMKDTTSDVVAHLESWWVSPNDEDEVMAVKIDASSLRGAKGNGSERLYLAGIQWMIYGTMTVRLFWKGTVGTKIMEISGNGSLVFDREPIRCCLKPNEADSPNGDLAISNYTVGNPAYSGYTIFLHLKKMSGYDYTTAP